MRMAPQLYMTMYKEHFSSPGRAKRAELRPTSANRRNNPQPRPDFLFPRSPPSNYRSTRAQSHPLPPVDTGRPLFPPVKHLSFHSPVPTCPDNSDANAGKPQHMPPVNLSAVQALPSPDRLQKLQLTEPLSATDMQLHSALKNPQRRVDYQRNVHPLSAQQLRSCYDDKENKIVFNRQNGGAQLRRPQTSLPHAATHNFARTQYKRCCSNSTLDYSGCYSCFHVVKPHQAGHYIIHPEFVSECLY